MYLKSLSNLFIIISILSEAGATTPQHTPREREAFDPAIRLPAEWSDERLVLFLDIRGVPIPFSHSALLTKAKENAHLAPEITGFDPGSFQSWSCEQLADYLGGPHVDLDLAKKDVDNRPVCPSSKEKKAIKRSILLDAATNVVSKRVAQVTLIADPKRLDDWSIKELRSYLRTYRISYPMPDLKDLQDLVYASRNLPILPLALETPSDIFDSLTSEQIVEWFSTYQGLNIALSARNHPMSRPFSAEKKLEKLRQAAHRHYEEMFAKDPQFEENFRRDMADVLGMVHVIEGTASDGVQVYYRGDDFSVLLRDQFGVGIPKKRLLEWPRQSFVGTAKAHTYFFAKGKLPEPVEVVEN